MSSLITDKGDIMRPEVVAAELGRPELGRALANSLAYLVDTVKGRHNVVSALDDDQSGMSIEDWYRFSVMTGLTPLLWSVATGRPVPPALVNMDVMSLITTRGYRRYANDIILWANSLGTGALENGIMKTMHDNLIDGLDRLAHNLLDNWARSLGVNRNDPCMCGSGRKMKACCGSAGMDGLIEAFERWQENHHATVQET
jgi:hypothetical protein